MLDENSIESMKKQVIDHIKKNFPENKKQEAIEQIISMEDEEFLSLLKENNIITDEKETNQTDNKCIFCSIIFGDIPSVKIEENEKAIAVLEINPISEGHILIVPKEHKSVKEKIDKKIEDLILSIKEKIENSLKPKEIKVFTSEITGHQIINLVPIYNNEDINSERKHVTSEELLRIKEKIKEIENKTEEKIQEENSKPEIYTGRIPRRIP